VASRIKTEKKLLIQGTSSYYLSIALQFPDSQLGDSAEVYMELS